MCCYKLKKWRYLFNLDNCFTFVPLISKHYFFGFSILYHKNAQEQLKDEDGDFIVNNDELTLNYDASDHFPVPAQNRTESSHPAGKENINDGDLGLGGYEFHSEPASGQSEFASSA